MALDTADRGLRIVASGNDTVLDLEPLQGLWTEEEYLKLTDHSRRLLEFTDGTIDVLPMPTDRHQVISQFLDIVVKRGEYAEASIPEYWMVNPIDETITVLTLAGDTYTEHGVFRRGDQAHSLLLKGFEVSVAEVFDAK